MFNISHKKGNENEKRLVTIGNGMAGIRCMEEILKHDSDSYEITIFGDEPHPNYNRIMLSHVLQGKTNMQDIIMNEYSWYEENEITLYTNERVQSINREEKLLLQKRSVLLHTTSSLSQQVLVLLFYLLKVPHFLV